MTSRVGGSGQRIGDIDAEHVVTDRLVLDRPRRDDLAGLYRVNSDPGVWEHYPTLVHRHPSDSQAFLDRWDGQWRDAGLGTWIARLRSDGRMVGYGGATRLGGEVWNIGYRLAPEHQGHGYATEMARRATALAAHVDPSLPRIAYLVEHNTASAHVAHKLGMTVVHRGPDAGNPDAGVTRVVYADRPLSPEQLAVTTR